MAKRQRIGVTGNARRWAPSWWCTALVLRMAGAVPERISVRHTPRAEPLDALIIGGGNDISPEHYNGDIDARVILDPDRDLLEIAWIRKALENNIPLLGICRGAQLINVVLGGSLYQDIRFLRFHTHNRFGILPTKRVRLEGDSQLAKICGKTCFRVNSLHHQAIDRPGVGLRVVGQDLDRIVQAAESGTRSRILCVQWHPEYLLYLPSQFAIFRWLMRKET